MSTLVFGEYTTLTELKNQYLNSTTATLPTTDDTLLLDLIREASRMIDRSGKTTFYPLQQTLNFDLPLYGVDLFPSVPKLQPSDEMKLGGLFGAELRFGMEKFLLEVVSLVNGDGSTIGSTNYWLYPANLYPKRSLKLKPTSGVTWLLDSLGNWEQAIQLNAIWGYHEDYDTYAWTSQTTLAAQINASVTTITAPTGKLVAGNLVKIDSEFFYVSATSAGSPNDTDTVVRAVNGTAATTHTTSAPVYLWSPDRTITSICRRAAAALYDLRRTLNPIGGTLQIDAITVQTPGDVQTWIDGQMDKGGMERIVVG